MVYRCSDCGKEITIIADMVYNGRCRECSDKVIEDNLEKFFGIKKKSTKKRNKK